MKFFHNYFIHIFFEYVNYVKASFGKMSRAN